MTRDEALNLLYDAFTPQELGEWIARENLLMGRWDSERMGRNIMHRIALELADDEPPLYPPEGLPG